MARPYAQVLFGVVSVLSVAIACSSEDTATGDTNDDAGFGGSGGGAGAAAAGGGGAGAEGGTGEIADAGNDAPSCPEYTQPSTGICKTWEQASADCLVQAHEEQPTRRTDREDCDLGCFCGRCLEAFALCANDPGCKAIIECAGSMPCEGIECANDQFCGGVIADNGGILGTSAQLAINFNDCLEAQSCTKTCGPDGGVEDGGTDAATLDAGATPDGSSADAASQPDAAADGG